MINFEFLNKPEFHIYARIIFDILEDNMLLIAPTGNSREDDFNSWFNAVGDGLSKESRQIILIKDNDNIIGFFQYYVGADTFMMEEIQFKPEYQGKGVFRQLYSFILKNISNDLEYVEAYASVYNTKSIGILEMLGLSNICSEQNELYHFRGRFEDLIKWFESK